MNDLELAQLAERLRRLEESLEPVPRGPLAGGGWRESDRHCCFIGHVAMAGFVKSEGTPIGFTDGGHEWLLCNGQAVGRTAYAELFAAIGTAFGTGDGATTFNLPKFTHTSYRKGFFPVGAGPDPADYPVGDTGGDKEHAHNLAGCQTSATPDWPHSHGGMTGANSCSGQAAAGAGAPIAADGHTHGLTTADATYPGHDHQIAAQPTDTVSHIPPYRAVGFFILAKRS